MKSSDLPSSSPCRARSKAKECLYAVGDLGYVAVRDDESADLAGIPAPTQTASSLAVE